MYESKHYVINVIIYRVDIFLQLTMSSHILYVHAACKLGVELERTCMLH